MNDTLALEPWLRSGALIATVTILLLAERRWPRRAHGPFRRLVVNTGLLITNTLAIRLVSIGSLVAWAAWAQAEGWGLFSVIAAPAWLEGMIAFVILDASMYLQHRLYHSLPWMWRLHAVHHSDTTFDTTTGIRFHPGEILTSFAVKGATVALLGASLWAVLLFEVALSSASLVTHANVRIPTRLDAALRSVIVTPDMHRVHHSVTSDEHDTNFGFLLIWWDRLFGSYRAQPRGEHASMYIGLSRFRRDDEQRFVALLKQPMIGPTDSVR